MEDKKSWGNVGAWQEVRRPEAAGDGSAKLTLRTMLMGLYHGHP